METPRTDSDGTKRTLPRPGAGPITKDGFLGTGPGLNLIFGVFPLTPRAHRRLYAPLGAGIILGVKVKKRRIRIGSTRTRKHKRLNKIGPREVKPGAVITGQEKKMKCLSLKQPWANLIADGKKTIETRTWGTKYTGPFAIASSKKPDIYPAGCVVCTATLVGCRPMIIEDEPSACCRIYDGAVAWVLKDVTKIPPQKVKGMMGLYDIELESLPLLGK